MIIVNVYMIEDDEPNSETIEEFGSIKELSKWKEINKQNLVLDLSRMILMHVGSTGMADVYSLEVIEK
jgi:hypothetical protein